jgi:hypothetical protein
MRALRILFGSASLILVLFLAGEPVRAATLQSVTLYVSNPSCTQPQPATGACYINLRYFYAVSTDPNFNHIEITVDGKVRFRMTGFFETSAYMVGQMLGKGLLVTCGLPGESGVAGFGHVYSVGLSAFVNGSSPITDFANVTCPSFVSKNYVPAVDK